MFARYLHRRSIRLRWVLLAVVAVLYAQGLRVCVHGGSPTDLSAGHAPVSSLCLENAVLASFGPCCDGEHEVSICGLLQHAPAAFPFLPPIVLAMLSPPRVLLHVVPPPPQWLPTRSGFALRPPLRAPPR